MEMEIETERLILRPLTMGDLDDLAAIYAKADVMALMGGVRSHEETVASITRQFANYAAHGFGLWATIYKPENRFIGRCGLLPQTVNGRFEAEVAYLLDSAYWRQGLATEAARASRDWAVRNVLPDRPDLTRLISLIRPENGPSRRVAERNGMTVVGETFHADLPHLIYAVSRADALAAAREIEYTQHQYITALQNGESISALETTEAVRAMTQNPIPQQGNRSNNSNREGWDLVINDVIVGRLALDHVDQPIFFCDFTPTAEFERVAPLFAEELRLLDADLMDEWIEYYERIDELKPRLVSGSGVIDDPLLHIKANEAWFRY